MTTDRLRNGAEGTAPTLFSFITLRKEAFGGILFNPFLPVEAELDPPAAFMAARCNGGSTVEEIVREAGSAFGLSRDAAASRWEETLAVLNSACAVRFVEKAPPETSCNAEPSFPGGSAPLSAPKAVIWDVTYDCNMSCPHCLTDSGLKARGELDTRAAFRLIDVLSAAKVLYLSLSGGEPLLRKDILDLLRRIAGTGMRVDIATNGFDLPID